MRRDLEECGRMLKTPVFVVNAVLNGALSVVDVSAGDPVAAHREGIKLSRRIFGVEIDAPADVLITGSDPLNIDLRQGLKGLANTIRAVRPGGVMVNLVAAEQGLGDMTMPSKNLWIGKKTLRALAYALLPLFGRSTFGLKEEDLYFIYFALQAFKRNDLYFYSPNVPEQFSKRMPFFEIHRSTATLMKRVEAAMPGKARVLVFPHAGVTYPVLPTS
jgi:nickel-dependent lactate racemase